MISSQMKTLSCFFYHDFMISSELKEESETFNLETKSHMIDLFCGHCYLKGHSQFLEYID